MTLYQNIAGYHLHVDRRFQWKNRGDIQSLLKLGNFGCAAAEHLSHEIVVLDGIIYGMDQQGKVFKPDQTKECSFTTMVQFEPTDSFDVASQLTFEEFLELLKQKIPQKTNLYAIKCEGTFKEIKGRTIYAVENGNVGGTEDDLPKVDFVQIEGTMVGFIFPEYLNNILAGHQYHFHFIDKTKTVGCHVFRFDPIQIKVDIMPIRKMVLNFDEF
jgi:acetolactate decarboxylase